MKKTPENNYEERSLGEKLAEAGFGMVMAVTGTAGVGEMLNSGIPDSAGEVALHGGVIVTLGAIAFTGIRMTFGAFDKSQSNDSK